MTPAKPDYANRIVMGWIDDLRKAGNLDRQDAGNGGWEKPERLQYE